MQAQFKPGDIVMLKSGGPDMTVNTVDGRDVYYQWFVGTKLESGSFGAEQLVHTKGR